ncbi:Hsp20/alpha crystallin family protein [Patescibacteria group bacterium]|nr:Hsp20/alpha crystallin family protein [Patescibacteria group bacterium]
MDGRDFFEDMMDMIEHTVAQAFRQAGMQYIPSRPQARQEEPHSEIMETDAEYVLTAELPGVDKKDIRINASENEIQIAVVGAAEKKHSRYGGLSKTYEVGEEIIPDKIKAKHKNGVLEVSAPKKNPGKKTRIKID